jgi:hypothetical protein
MIFAFKIMKDLVSLIFWGSWKKKKCKNNNLDPEILSQSVVRGYTSLPHG